MSVYFDKILKKYKLLIYSKLNYDIIKYMIKKMNFFFCRDDVKYLKKLLDFLLG